MAIPNSSYTEMITMTIENRRRKIADNVTNHNALLARLKERGNVDLFSGGHVLLEELAYKENETFGWYDGYELINITPQQVHSAAEFEIKQAAVSISISGLEMLQNAGKEKMIPLLKARTDNAEDSMVNGLASAVYSDGTDAKEIGGLQLLVADDPTTGTVGGIDRSAQSFWRNQTADEVFSSTDTPGDMRSMWLSLVRGSDKPDLILADTVAYNAFWDSLTEIQRLTKPGKGVSGFKSLAFQGPNGEAPVVFDDQCPDNHMYFINTKYLKYRPHRDRNIVALDQRKSINQDAVVVLMVWAGNMTLSNASLQGVIFDGS